MARPRLLQLRAEPDKLSVWVPAEEGLWEYRPLRHWRRHDPYVLDDPKLVLVRGIGLGGDNGVCMVVTGGAGDVLRPADEVRSVRQLDAGHWTFLRPVRADDPEIPGA